MTIKLWKLVYQAVDLQTKQLPELRYALSLILNSTQQPNLASIHSGMMRRCQSTV